MRESLRLEAIALFLLSLFFLMPMASSPLFAASEGVSSQDMTARVKKLEDKLTEIKTQQTSILDKQKEILEKLDQVKIWVHRG